MPATMLQPAANQPKDKDSNKTVLVPFTRAAKPHVEPFIDEGKQMVTGSSQALGPYDVPAYGYARHLVLDIQASGGAGNATVALQEDAPWSIIQEISLIDVNGAPIVGPISGYDLYLANKWLGVNGMDPKLSPVYSAPVTGANGSGNFRFLLRVPIEISQRDGLGCLPNQNAASTFKLRITLAAPADVYSTAPNTTLPTVRVRGHLEAWTQPTPADLRGNGNSQQPPAVGTTAYLSKTVVNLASGQQTVRLPRVGNYIRNLIFIARNTSGSRATGTTYMPDPMTLSWDTKQLEALPVGLWKQYMAERTGYTAAEDAAGGLDKGVFVKDFCHEFDGKIGNELRDGWLPTVQSTRLEVAGSFGGATALTIITQDISPAGEIFL